MTVFPIDFIFQSITFEIHYILGKNWSRFTLLDFILISNCVLLFFFQISFAIDGFSILVNHVFFHRSRWYYRLTFVWINSANSFGWQWFWHLWLCFGQSRFLNFVLFRLWRFNLSRWTWVEFNKLKKIDSMLQEMVQFVHFCDIRDTYFDFFTFFPSESITQNIFECYWHWKLENLSRIRLETKWWICNSSLEKYTFLKE